MTLKQSVNSAWRRGRCLLVGVLLCSFVSALSVPSIAAGQTDEPVANDNESDPPTVVNPDNPLGDPPAEEARDAEEQPQEKEVELGATDIGVRMTPAIAQAISGRMSEQMKQRYELDDKQVGEISKSIERNIMEMAHENAAIGRDAIEGMMAGMIANDGQLPREAAIDLAKNMKPLIPVLRQFFQESAADVGKSMTLKQRLRFTGDMTGLMAGLAVFESRMTRWEQGQVKDGANPFFDRGGDDEEDEADAADPNETREMRRARRRVDRTLDWQLNVENNWDQYVRNAIIYYDFDESQQAAANGILTDCKERAAKVKTPEWREKLRANRIADQLSWQVDSKFSQGPIRFQIETAHEKLMKPLNDIEKRLKQRIEKLPTSTQRAEAHKSAEKVYQEKGIDKLPV